MLVIAGVVSMVALAGCTPAPSEPLPIPTSATTSTPSATPTPEYTPGVDPDADVAAAISTYEAYVEANNDVELSDSETWDSVLALLADPYLSDSISSYEELAAAGYKFEGDAQIVSAVATKVQSTIVNLHVCTDFAETMTLDSNGVLIGSAEDYAVKSMNVILQSNDGVQFGWAIVHIGWSDLTCS
ncbi:hypothetical protein GCM10009860_10630 [Microbacterium mitrae]